MNYNEEEDDAEVDQGDGDSVEGEFQDLNPSEYKKHVPLNPAKKGKQQKKKAPDACEMVEPDPIKRRQLANGQHVPVRFEMGENMNINIQYDDGQMRKFGQQKFFEEKLVPISKSGTFIYEASETKQDKRTSQKNREDTRSLFDDPKLQKLRTNYTPRILQKMTQGEFTKNEEEQHVDQGVSWKPVRGLEDIPQSFYMAAVFDRTLNGPRQINTETIKSEYDAFRLYFDKEIYDQIIKFTRERYQQKVEESIYSYIHGFYNSSFTSKKPVFQKWDFNEYELEAYFAVQIFFGIVRLSNQRDYWKSNGRTRPGTNPKFGQFRKKKQELASERLDRYSHWVTQRMSSIVGYEKFKTIRACLNISGAEALKYKGRDPIWKIRDFLNQMNQRFSKYYYPGEFLTIDEGMIPFAGKVAFKVYNPDKPTKWGIKEYLLCDAVNCYTLMLKLYHGQTMWSNDFKQTVFVNEEDTQTRTMELVLQMCKDYEHKAHNVVMDNYYSSWQLFRELKNRGIGSVGTIRHNRTGLTKRDLTSKHFQQIYNQYHYAFYINQSNELILMYFQGTSEKEIALISNFLDNSLNEQHMWDIAKQHYYVPHPKAPYIMYVYNKFKGGVDRRNSYVVKYRSRFPVKKWWQSVFERLFETAILNAFLIFKWYNPESVYRNKGQMRDFRINLMYQFAERYKQYMASADQDEVGKGSFFAKIQPHTFIEGEELVKCAECGNETKTFCQECTILKAEIIGLCDEKDTVKCQRFHEFMDLDLDKSKEVFDKKKGRTPYEPNHFQELHQRTNKQQSKTNASKDNKSEQKTEHQNNPLLNLLQTIQNTVTQEAKVKREVKKESSNVREGSQLNQQDLNDEDVVYQGRSKGAQIYQEIHDKVEQMSCMNSDSFINGSIPDSEQLYQECDNRNLNYQQQMRQSINKLIQECSENQSNEQEQLDEDEENNGLLENYIDRQTEEYRKMQQRNLISEKDQQQGKIAHQVQKLDKYRNKLRQESPQQIQEPRPSTTLINECLKNILTTVQKQYGQQQDGQKQKEQ